MSLVILITFLCLRANKVESMKKRLNILSEITLIRPINYFLYKKHPITHINFSVLKAGIDDNQINNYLNQDF